MQHCQQHRAQLESCIVCPPLKLLPATLRATVAEVESASTSATLQATVSPCVHHLQHCVQLRDAKVVHNVASCFRALQVIVTYLVTLSIAEASRACLVSYNCVDKYVRLFQHRATLSPLVSDNARPKKIPWWMEAYLEALVRIYPSLYLRELQHLLLKRL